MSVRRAAAPARGPLLLATKFLPPLPGPSYVRRERLHRRLAHASSTPITLLSAPAGCGKTALLSAWVADLPAGTWAWLSIDRQDNDPGRLWAHLIAAVQRLAGSVGEAALVELRRSGGQGPIEGWLTPLINDLATSTPTATVSFLVLEDVHLLTDTDVRSSLGELASHLPPWLHLVLSTRADPPLPLPRLRAEARLTEIRAADLRFRPDEAVAFLAACGIDDVDATDLELLVRRTEGWAAGLQLAAIRLDEDGSTLRIPDVVGSLRPFTDYLITEVVENQTPDMRAFLFATSILDRINPSLATAVTGMDDAVALLRRAEQRGLFLYALDGRDEWYRYHHMFAEALRHEFGLQSPEAAQAAHTAAARWFEQHGDAAIALEHWLDAGRPDEALRLAVDVGYALVDRGEAITLERIARRIPASVPGDDPGRQLDYGLLHFVFEPETFLAWVDEAANTLAVLDEPDPAIVARYLMARSMADLAVGAWDDAFRHATEAVERGRAAEAGSGYSQRARLQLMRAAGWVERPDVVEAGFKAYWGDPRLPEALRLVVAPSIWALAAALAGRIDHADRWSQSAAAYAAANGVHNKVATQEMLLAQAMVQRERGDGDAAVRSVEELRSVGLEAYFSLRAVAEVEVGLVRLGQGRFDAAAVALDAALRARPDGELDPLVVSRVDAARSAWCVATDDLVGARRVAERMLGGIWRQVALARVLIAEGASQEAENTLRALSPATPRQHVVVGLLKARSLADRSPDGALEQTGDALRVAAAEGMLTTVVAAGVGVADLIEKASWVVPEAWMNAVRLALAGGPSGLAGGRIAQLVEQPTDRERAALRLLASRLTVSEIARELGVSPNTLKSHLKALYRKLGVTSREEAVTVARQLSLLG